MAIYAIQTYLGDGFMVRMMMSFHNTRAELIYWGSDISCLYGMGPQSICLYSSRCDIPWKFWYVILFNRMVWFRHWTGLSKGWVLTLWGLLLLHRTIRQQVILRLLHGSLLSFGWLCLRMDALLVCQAGGATPKQHMHSHTDRVSVESPYCYSYLVDE